MIGSATNLRDALAYIIQKQPQYVLISADHPNRKVKVLPKMLVQAFPCRIIGFAEKNSGLSTKNLHEMGLEYNLYPPVSGPAILRMVLRIQKEEEQRALAAEQAANNPKTSETPGNDTITFRGDAPTASQANQSFEQARAALSQMISSDGDEDGEPTEDSGMIVQKGSGGGPKGPAYWGGAAGGDPSATGGAGQGGLAYRGGLDGSGAPGSGDIGGSSSGGHGPGRAHDGGPGNQGLGGSMGGGSGSLGSSGSYGSGSTPGGPASSSSPSPFGGGFFNPQEPGGFHDGNSNWESGTPSPGTKPPNTPGNWAGKQAPIMESDYRKNEKKDYKITSSEERAGRDNDSIIVKGTQAALEESVNTGNADKAQKIERSSNVACITVQSPRFSGYLVCAMGRDRKIDKPFIDMIQKRLFGFLKANGESIEEKDTMNLKIQEVDFTDWALEQAEFLKKSIHDGDEIAMAFFPTNEIEVKLEDSASEKMVKMELKDLKEDVPLEFDLYIFMPENNKYLLYTPKGRPFAGQQKGRLNEKGVTHMHLRKDSAHNVKKYKAQNFLNEKIASYRKTKTEA